MNSSPAWFYRGNFVARFFRLFIAPSMALLILSSSWAMPALADASSTNNKTLVALETKFFEHTYASDSDEDRVARLEKLIFGESKSGDLNGRLADIQKIVATNDGPGSSSSASNTASNSSSSSSSSSSGSSNSSATSASQAGSGGGSSSSTASVPSGSYPRVDALEELLLNTSNKKLSLEKRLGLMEKKAFGRPSNSDDMSARTDALEQYWQKSLSPAVNQKYDQQLTQLESQVIGQSYPDKPIIERLQTLEGIVFPNEAPDTHASIKEQLTTLANAVQISAKQGKKPSASAVDAGQSGQPVNQNQAYNTGNSGAGNYGSYGQALPDQTTSQASSQSGSGNYGSYGNYGQTTPYTSSGSYGTQAGYANTATSGYSGQPASSSYNNQGQYANTNTATTQAPPANYGQITPFANSPTQNEQYGGQSASNEQKGQGHPLLKGLAKALGAAAGMAAGAVGTGMMYNSMGGYGGYGGYGGMGYGGYGGYGMGGYGMPYGMGGYGSPYGYGGMGGLGSSLGRWW